MSELSGVRSFLTGLGMSEDIATNAIVLINRKEGEDLPEGIKFNSLDDIKNEFTKTREELIIQKNREDIIAKYEKETQGKKWAEFSNPLLQFVKKEGNFQKEDLEGLQVKEAIKKLIDEKNKAILAASSNMDDTHLQKITTLQDEKQSLINELDAFKLQSEQQIKQARDESENKIYSFYTTDYINKRIYSKDIEFDIPEKRELYKQLIMPRIMSTYKVDYQTGMIKMPNGEKALAFDGNGYYDHVDQAIKALAKEMNILKLSNGQGGKPDAVDKKYTQVGNQKVDLSGTNQMKAWLG